MLRAKDRRGSSAVELALMAPAFIAAAIGMADVVHMLRAELRLEGASQQINQVVSQCNTITTADVTQFWAEAQQLLKGVADLNPTGGAVIVSAVYNDRGVNRVAWQIRTGNGQYASAIGAAGGTATLPGGFAPPGDHTVIVAETFALVKHLAIASAPQYVKRFGFGSPDGKQLTGTTLLVSRALDPVRLRQPPTSSGSMACTA